MKRFLGVLVASMFLASAAYAADAVKEEKKADAKATKEEKKADAKAMKEEKQVTGPVVDVKDDVIIVKKGSDNWEIARDRNTKATGEIKKGDRVTIKYKMIATSIEAKEAPKGKAEAKDKADDKMKGEAKTK